MSLSPTDLSNLKNHAIDPLSSRKHPALEDWIDNSDWLEIANWYNTIPVPVLNELMAWMDFQDKANFYPLPIFREWYGELCQKIVNNTFNSVTLTEYPSLSKTDEELKKILIDLIFAINQHKEANKPFAIVVEDVFKRSQGGNIETQTTLKNLLIAMRSDNIFSEYTYLIYAVEISQALRWVSLGFPSAPTAIEVETALA